MSDAGDEFREAAVEDDGRRKASRLSHHTFAVTVEADLDQEAHDRISRAIHNAALFAIEEMKGADDRDARLGSAATNCGGCSTG